MRLVLKYEILICTQPVVIRSDTFLSLVTSFDSVSSPPEILDHESFDSLRLFVTLSSLLLPFRPNCSLLRGFEKIGVVGGRPDGCGLIELDTGIPAVPSTRRLEIFVMITGVT